MPAATIATILSLIPVAERLIFDVGGKLIELNTADISAKDLIQALEGSKSATWPILSFAGPQAGEASK